MESNQNSINDVQEISTSQLISMFAGFILFISGLFLVMYSFFAWLLVTNIEQSIIYSVAGGVACYLGRKVIRRVRKQQAIAELVQ